MRDVLPTPRRGWCARAVLARRLAVLLGLCLLATLAGRSTAALAGPLGAADIFRGRMLTQKAPVEPPVINVQVEVESWTTVEEIRQLQDLLGQSGVEAMLSYFNSLKKGVVRFMSARGWNLPIHAAVSTPAEKGKRILLFFNRQNWDPGSRFMSTGRNFFMVMELKLNEKGKGEGRFYEDAQVKIDAGLGHLDLQSYDSAPKILPQVQEVIKKKSGS